MHGLRKLTGLAAALLCLMLAGPVAHSEQGKSPESGKEEKSKHFPIGDDDIVVKPKGGGVYEAKSGKTKDGFDWVNKKTGKGLQYGADGQFRCDLFQRLDKLEVEYKGKPEPADAVHFDLEGFVFEVTKTYGVYTWSFPKDAPVACATCGGDGVPLQYMDGKADGTIKAKLSSDPNNWVPVKAVYMHGKVCP